MNTYPRGFQPVRRAALQTTADSVEGVFSKTLPASSSSPQPCSRAGGDS